MHTPSSRPPIGSVFAFAIALAVTADAAPAGLVHHWNFDEGPDWHDRPFLSVHTGTVARDVVGGAHGSFQNMAATNWVSGRQFTALRFNGVNQRLAVATNLATTLGGTASLSFWLQTTQAGSATVATAPGVTGVTGPGGAQWGWLDDQGRIGLAVEDTLLVRSTNAVNDGEWRHVVLTRDSASGAGQVYVDGVLQASGTGVAGVKSAPFSSLGRLETGGAGNHFAGRLDQIHIFNRVITAAEVALLRTNHAPKLWVVTTEGVNDRPFTTHSVFSRAYDVERDPLTVWSWTQPAQGTVTHNGNGSFQYTANPGFLGGDAFTVTVEDGKGGFYTVTNRVEVMSEPPGGGGVPVTQFTNMAPLQSSGTNMFYNGWRVPRALDWNKDGRLDLLVSAGGAVWLHTNVGTVSAPVFQTAGRVRAAGVDIATGTTQSGMTLTDMSGDGIPDLVVSDSANKLRVYRNTAASNAPPVYAAAVFVKNTAGADFVLPDRRFDLGDWDGDGKPDLVTGTFSGDMRLYLNVGTPSDPRYDVNNYTVILSSSYNLYPRLYDLNGNGRVDFLRSINWGDILYWRDVGWLGISGSTTLTLLNTNGVAPAMQSLTDGAMVDFGDYNGDGVLDLLVGGHASTNLFLAWGGVKTIAQSLAEIEAIYNVDTNNVGVTLSANADALLGAVNNANWNLISHLRNGTLGMRENLFTALTNHIGKYAFLKYQAHNTNNFHHVPSIVLQNWVMLHYTLADTPARRQVIADVLGLTGTMRTIYLENGLALGDRGLSLPATYGTIRDFLRRHPRELFPDAILTTDQLYGDGRGGFVWTPNSTKNTFGQWALGNANEWAGDLTAAVNKELGSGAASGDYFTFVMGHEVIHSLDNYVNTRANADLRKRWGLTPTTAAGPDVMAGTNGWRDVAATKTNFLAKGYWNGVEANWNAAWAAYWTNGPGTAFRSLSFMRGNIDWFMDNSQESLATQANHHWANARGRLIGAADRFRRASGPGLGPLRANINEVVTFIDFLSGGMNRVNLVETKYQASPQQVNWFDHYADLERDDRGYIRRLKVGNQTWQFDVNTNGVVTNLTTSLLAPQNDTCWTFRNAAREFDVLANDSRLEGGSVQLLSVNAPANGTVATNAAGRVLYTPNPGFVGNDSFTYTVTSAAGGAATATAFIEVITTNAPTGSLLIEYWHNIGSGTAVSDLTSHANFPNTPNVKRWTNSPFELPSNYADNFGSRARAQLVPTVSGTYTFWIASDDSSELWFSPDRDAVNKTLIASVSGWTSPREWTKFASQKSAPIPLVAGQAYYLETLHKDGSSLDNLAVAWSGPAPFDGTNVIAAANLIQPFAGFAPPQFTANPLVKPTAQPGVAYAHSIAGDVTDPSPGEVLTFSKLGGPAWLTVAANGTLSGTPSTGDAGVNNFPVRVMDSTGFAHTTTLRISVWNPVPPGLAYRADGQLELTGIVGQRYQVERTAALPPAGTWQVWADVASLPASPHLLAAPATNEQGFFRAVGLP
ncbi:MAG: Ig-like domain-containing protein [Limisphaerales bacterium]